MITAMNLVYEIQTLRGHYGKENRSRVGRARRGRFQGMTRGLLCDSHTSTQELSAALAHGIGNIESGHVLATQCLVTKEKAANMLDRVDGEIVQLGYRRKRCLRRLSVAIGNGGAEQVTRLDIWLVPGHPVFIHWKARMTVCNMAD